MHSIYWLSELCSSSTISLKDSLSSSSAFQHFNITAYLNRIKINKFCLVCMCVGMSVHLFVCLHHIADNIQGTKFSQILWLILSLWKYNYKWFIHHQFNIDYDISNCSNIACSVAEIQKCLELPCKQMNTKIQF